jgi:predicted regulator of Ras-like GTPase activity (Roadblock/LC7/MglB family)
LFAGLDGSPVEAAFLVRATGVLLASWTKRDVSREVATVMSATLVGSVQGLVEAFGCPTPKTINVSTEHCHIVARTVERDAILVLFAPRGVPRRQIEPIADRLAEQVALRTR